MSTLLVELGCEELPARELPALSRAFGQSLLHLLTDHRLAGEGSAVQVWSTPRRLACRIEGLGLEAAPVEEWRRGPALAQARQADGSWSQAAVGFARSLGTSPDQLEERDTEGGRYLFGSSKRPGDRLVDLLGSELEGLVTRLPEGRTMAWSEAGTRFLRPVRWLVVLVDDEVAPIRVAGVTAGRLSQAGRGRPPVEIASPQRYEAALAEAGVVADRGARREALVAGWRGLLQPGESFDDAHPLIDQVVDLVEGVRVLRGQAGERFRRLPEPILRAVMVDQLRVVPISRDQELEPAFLLAYQTGEESVVRSGFERVLEARLTDASFFVEADLQKPLAEHARSLGQITFLGKLGSLADRLERVSRLAGELVRLGGLKVEPGLLAEALPLVLADRATQAVAEWPELAGVIGAHYARAQGAPQPVVEAIAQSTWPAPGQDRLPESDLGWVLALSLKADELVGGFVAGLEPTGSSDPFGMRRLAQGVLSLLAKGKVGWRDLIVLAERGYALSAQAAEEILLRVDAFLRTRLEASWREQGHPPEVVSATLGAPLYHPLRLASRLKAVEEMWPLPSFQSLITVYRRTSRLAAEGPIDPALGEEETLKKAVVAAEVAVERALLAGDDGAALATLAALEAPLERFFDQVMVMDPDPVRRRVRQALLARVKALSDKLVSLAALAGGRGEQA